MEIITWDFIWERWKNNSYPDNFDNLLEEYIKLKDTVFHDVDVKGSIAQWTKKVLLSIEIGILRDKERFLPYRKYWVNLLGKDYNFSLEDRWITWKD